MIVFVLNKTEAFNNSKLNSTDVTFLF